MALIVYGSGLSPFVRKVRVMLIEKGVDYTLESVSPFNPPAEFLAISPLKRIPVLRDTDVPEPNTLPDSSIICDYIEHRFPAHPLYPADAFARARALWFEEYCDTILAETLARGVFFERVIKRILRQEPDESVCAATMSSKAPPLFDYLEREIGDKEHLVGDAFSIADISLATIFVNLAHSGEAPDAARWPQLTRYLKAIHERPSFKVLIEEDAATLSRLFKK